VTKRWLIALCCALAASTSLRASAQAQAPQPPLTDQVEDVPSVGWLVAGITLGAGSLALNIDSARRFDQGEEGCFPALEFGGCTAESLVAGPIGLLGGVGIFLYGKGLGEHDAGSALAQGRALEDHSSLETWSLIAVLGGYAISLGVNLYAVGRLFTDFDPGACEAASTAERSEACAGGSLLGLSIVQSAALAVALGAAGPLGYAIGYDSVRRKHAGTARATLLPWAHRDSFGLALGLSL
jgi:hypothetical protein